MLMLKMKKAGLLALSIGLAFLVSQAGLGSSLYDQKISARMSRSVNDVQEPEVLKHRNAAKKVSFSDLRSEDWYASDVEWLAKQGLVTGYEDGTFRPGKKITVGEFLKLLLVSVGEKVEVKEETDWYESYAKRAEELGVIAKRESYNYEAVISRTTMAKMVYNLLKLSQKKREGAILADVCAADLNWVETVFNECLMRGFMTNSGQVVFRPNQAATRGEACAVIARVLDYRRNPLNSGKAKVLNQASQREDNKSPSPIIQQEIGPAAKEIPVLMYHHILRKEENKNFKNNYSVISQEEFESQMKLLYEKGFYTMTPYEMEKFLKKEINLPDKSVLITFDDGYLSNYLYAYPILKRYGFKATLFVVTSAIRETPQKFNPDQLNFISWEEINKSVDVFDYASHTHAMHNQDKGMGFLVTKPESEVRQDIKRSKELLGLDYFAYPYGQYNAKTIAILQEAGFKLAFTTKEGNVTQESKPFELGRYYMNPGRDLSAILRKVYPDFDK